MTSPSNAHADITVVVSKAPGSGVYENPVDLFSLDSIGYNYTTYGLGYGLFTQCNSLSDKYEFGYNGQMKMNEIAGIGNHNTALFWEYSPQIGRRWNLDPVVKEWESSYATFSNNPIFYSDILGNISVPTPTASDQDGDGNKDREDKKEEDKKEKKKEETPNSSSSTTGGNSSSGTGGGGNKMSTGDQNAIKTAIAVPIPGLVTVPEVVIPAGAGTAIGAATGGIAIAVGGAYLFLKYALPAELTPAGWQEDPNSACSTQVWTPQGMKPKVFVPSAEAIRIGIRLNLLQTATEIPDLPTVDNTGKVHGDLPKVEDLGKYSKEDLEKFAKDLAASIARRIKVTSRLGRDRGHGQRQVEEQDLLKSLQKYLRDNR